MSKKQSRQLVKLLSIVRDSDQHIVGSVIAFLLQGNFDIINAALAKVKDGE